MKTLHLQTVVGPDGRVQLDIPSDLPPGPAEIVVVIAPKANGSKTSWHDMVGFGKEVWKGVDAQEYVSKLRDEWEK